MANKRQAILIVMALLIISGGLFTVSWYQKLYALAPTASPTKTTGSTSDQWTTYHNPKYHYRIDYPSDFQVMPSPFSGQEDIDSVSFAETGDPWQMRVMTNPSFHTLEEWVKVSNEESHKNAYLRE